MSRLTALALCALFASAPCLAESDKGNAKIQVLEAIKRHGFGLAIMTDRSGGVFAADSVETFRLLNPSSTEWLGSISAKTTGSGFKVVANDCPSALPPHKSCSVNVRWIPVGADMLANGSLLVNANANDKGISVSVRLSGNSSLTNK